MQRLLGHIIHKSPHPEGDAIVLEHHGTRYLHIGSDAIQSAMDLLKPDYLKLTYTQHMMGVFLFIPPPKHCLLFGLGGGALAKYLLAQYQDVKIDAIEIRQDIINIAHSHFFVPHDKRLAIQNTDAHIFALTSAKQGRTKYDLILVDAYDQHGMVASTQQTIFLECCAQLLQPEGCLVLNTWARTSQQLKDLLAQLAEVFDQPPLCLPVPEKGNIIVFISHKSISPQMLKQHKKKAKLLEQQFDLPFSRYLKDLIKHNSKSWLHNFLSNKLFN